MQAPGCDCDGVPCGARTAVIDCDADSMADHGRRAGDIAQRTRTARAHFAIDDHGSLDCHEPKMRLGADGAAATFQAIGRRGVMTTFESDDKCGTERRFALCARGSSRAAVAGPANPPIRFKTVHRFSDGCRIARTRLENR